MIGLGRAYTVTFTAVAVTTVEDLFYVKPAADKILIIEGCTIDNVSGTADAGDAHETLLRVEIIRLPATVTVGSGGTAPTPSPIAVNDTAASFTARVNDTTLATSSGTVKTLAAAGFNIRSGWIWLPPPEHRIVVANAEAIVVRLNLAPPISCNMSGTLTVRELP